LSKRVLMLINGLGLGNSTRCHAIITNLLKRGASVSVVTSGNGAWYFRNQSGLEALYEIEEMYYGAEDGGLSIYKTITSAVDLLKIIRKNSELTNKYLDAAKPDVVVSDSVYSVFGVRKRGIPLVSINNSDVVHVGYRQLSNQPRSIRLQFYCIEEMDYLFHRIVPDLVLSPSLDPNTDTASSNFHRIGPIVRMETPPAKTRDSVKRVLIMLSGSQFGSPVKLDPEKHNYHIDVVGRDPQSSQISSDNITFHGKKLDNEQLIKDADLMVVNGGFSAISEAFVIRTPMIVIPISNHAEQWVNATTIERLGVGIISDDAGLEDAIISMSGEMEKYQSAYAKLPAAQDGARQAANEILIKAN
jgi:UDP:flavonoid glycosyltransferase YjiC (YdhE family)